MGLDEHPHGRLVHQIFRGGLALGSVVADSRTRGFEFGERVTAHDPIQLGMAQRARDPGVAAGFGRGLDEQLGAHVRPVDDRCERDRAVGPQALCVPVEQRHQSSSSMNRWIVPPQVRPTAKASSSE